MGTAPSIRTAIMLRAAHRCEYCRLPMDAIADPFHVDHIVARQHGGQTVLHNLALSCTHCNAHKGPNLAGIDPVTGTQVSLFNPRTDSWPEHFERRGATVRGLTSVGRASILVLAMNDPNQIELRLVLIEEGRLAQDDVT